MNLFDISYYHFPILDISY